MEVWTQRIIGNERIEVLDARMLAMAVKACRMLNKWSDATELVFWFGQSSSESSYFLPEGSGIRSSWKSRPPALCGPYMSKARAEKLFHSVQINTQLANILLTGLARAYRWQEFWTVFKMLFVDCYFPEVFPDSNTFTLLIKTATTASILADRGGNNPFIDKLRAEATGPTIAKQSDSWDGQAAHIKAVEVIFSVLKEQWEARQLDPALFNLGSGSLLSRFTSPPLPPAPLLQQRNSHVSSLANLSLNADVFMSLIGCLGTFNRSTYIQRALVYQRFLCTEYPGQASVATALLFMENDGATKRSVKAMEDFLQDWVGAVPSLELRAKALKRLTTIEWHKIHADESNNYQR